MIDALIVGAGPVGLTAALELTRRGFTVEIVDRNDTFAAQSRAIGVNPRTLDILEPSGAAKRILDEGLRINRARMTSRGKEIGVIEFGCLNHRFPFMTALPQSRTERILADTLSENGVKPIRCTTFAGYETREGHVLSRLDSADGGRKVASRYLIGCDGSHSDVRLAAGIAFEGSSYEHDWTLADIEADWPMPDDEVDLFFQGKRGMLFVVPVGGEAGARIRRIVHNGPDPEKLLPAEVTVRRMLWKSAFRISHKLAEQFNEGPVFIAGDAAHVHSPAGARGMNGGIEDAATLAWLMETNEMGRYDVLRRRHARRVIRQVDQQTRQADAREGLFTTFREWVAPIALGIPAVQRAAARFITALDTKSPEWL